MARPCLDSVPGVGGRGCANEVELEFGLGGLALTEGLRNDGEGVLCAKEDVDRLNGFLRAGYA